MTTLPGRAPRHLRVRGRVVRAGRAALCGAGRDVSLWRRLVPAGPGRRARRRAAGRRLAGDRAQDATEQALAELRTVARGILPPVLSDRGLAEAVEGLAADCAVPCRADVALPGRCAASVEATAYFVVAEALTNVAKHSRSHWISVTAQHVDGRLRIVIEDDGQGFDSGLVKGTGSKCFGLSGMRERLALVGGDFAVESALGRGTTVYASLPSAIQQTAGGLS